jgi:hypothetical protein
MDNTLLGIPFSVLGVICLGIAAPWFFIWPLPDPRKPPRPAWRHLILRWFHGLTWVLLALACFAAAAHLGALAGTLAILGLAAYIAFIATIFIDRRAT